MIISKNRLCDRATIVLHDLHDKVSFAQQMGGRRKVGRLLCVNYRKKIWSHGHNEINIFSRLELLRDSYFHYKRKHGERENRTYPSGKTDVIDKTENVGRAQVQHRQQGLEKKEIVFSINVCACDRRYL